MNVMPQMFPRIDHPELFFGFVSPIGVDLEKCVTAFEEKLGSLGYDVIKVKVTDIFRPLAKHIDSGIILESDLNKERYSSHIQFGNYLRSSMDDDAILASLTIARIAHLRSRDKTTNASNYDKTAWLIYQFKRKEEVDFLRSVYGRLFFQISAYSRRATRVNFLAQLFAQGANSQNTDRERSSAEEIVETDTNEQLESHGQKVGKVFHDADFIVNMDLEHPPVEAQVDRFCRLLFGGNDISPTKIEYGMFMAKAAALRTLDLSRQVGAAIFSESGEVIAMGSNEVPKGTGGSYWADDGFDDREYKRGQDTNERLKRVNLTEILDILKLKPTEIDMEALQNSQFMDVLEYGRMVHAEMSAITDAARVGNSLRGSILYCTTFPCHMCAKHIVAAGIAKIYFLEPYPKSLVGQLHSDSVSIEGEDRGKFKDYPAVLFEHSYGVSPRRFRELFEREKRKDSSGKFSLWKEGRAKPNIIVNEPYYGKAEEIVLKDYVGMLLEKHGIPADILVEVNPEGPVGLR